MNPVNYDRYGKNVAKQLPLIFENFPIVGNIEFLTAMQPPNKSVFNLEDHFVLRDDGRFHPRYFPTRYTIHDNVFGAIRESYPVAMLPADSKLYAVINGIVMEGKTKKVKPFEHLEDFISYVQSVDKEGATVVSSNRRDFEALTTIMEIQGGLWGISEGIHDNMLYTHDNMLYRVHVFGTPSKPKPPKYQRRK